MRFRDGNTGMSETELAMTTTMKREKRDVQAAGQRKLRSTRARLWASWLEAGQVENQLVIRSIVEGIISNPFQKFVALSPISTRGCKPHDIKTWKMILVNELLAPESCRCILQAVISKARTFELTTTAMREAHLRLTGTVLPKRTRPEDIDCECERAKADEYSQLIL